MRPRARWTRGSGRLGKRTGIAVAVIAAMALAGTVLAPAGGSARLQARGHGSTEAQPAAKTGVGGRALLLRGSPGVPLANPRTNTLYVPIQCTDSSCKKGDHVLQLIDASKCNSTAASHCRVVATAAVGKNPLAATIDGKTNTIYVANGAGSVSVLNGARCNAKVTRGCGKPRATIKLGGFPVAAAFNPRTRTVYVASPKGQVFVINGAACNAVTIRGCKHAVRTVKDKLGPDGIAVDLATDTVYAANSGAKGNGNTVSVIDGSTCNGHNGTGCRHQPHTIKVGVGAYWDVVDQATNSVYVANYNDGTVSIIDGRHCNAKVTAGCRHTARAVTTGAGTAFVAIDTSRHTLFALNQGDGTLSAINTRTCNGAAAGCPKRARNERATFNPPQGYNSNALALIPHTGTAYLVNVGGENYLAAASIKGCNAVRTLGCRREAPQVPEHDFLLSADSSTNTIYASNNDLPVIDVLNAASCKAGQPSGCVPVATIPIAHPRANVGAIDKTTHTLYASDSSGDTISVINTATCNATHIGGCHQVTPKIKVGRFPSSPVLNPATRTLYTPFGPKGDQVAVVNAATCNAGATAGCGQNPATVKVGPGTNVVAVSAATNTVYAPSAGASQFNGNKVSVIDGSTCNGTNHTGCKHAPATVKVGSGPFGVAVNDLTHSVYVANNANGDLPGTVSIINGATCNGSHTAGCAAPVPAVGVGRSPLLVAVDPSADVVYVTDYSSAAVSVIRGSKCRAGATTGCATAVSERAVGSAPFGIAVNPTTRTVFVANGLAPGSISLLSSSK